jgi:hypothetical protein
VSGLLNSTFLVGRTSTALKMSKKNNKGTRRRRHEHDLQREKEAAQEIAKKSQKMEEKLKVTNTKPRKKVTGIRIRKNVTVKVSLQQHQQR